MVCGVMVGNTMDVDGIDKIDYQHQAEDKRFKIKGAYLVPCTDLYSIPYVCR
jgi:hypothetical protein